MKLYLLIAFIITTVTSACVEKSSTKTANNEPMKNLSSYRWKNRIILTFPKNEAAAKNQLLEIKRAQAEIKDMDLIILRLDLALGELTEKARLDLIKKYKLTSGTHILIGKDGGVKSKQKGTLDLNEYFKLINTMPMRIQEKKNG